MKTKLEIGKEYWLSEQKISRGIYLGESNSGNFDFRITLGSKHTKPLGELDVMTSNLSVYSEYIPEKPWEFTTPIAMKCTEEQFNWIKDKLVEMGYKLENIEFSETLEYLCSAYCGVNNSITTLHSSQTSDRGRFVFETFNPALFLALTAMTDKEDGINGEWWRYVYDMHDPIVAQKYLGEFTVPNESWRKATAQEIIEHFEKKEFMLPEKWCVKVTVKNSSYLNAFAFTSGYYGLCNFNKYFTSDIVAGVKTGNGYTEITFDQFKKYVLKETPQSCQIIPIPPAKQATLFDDRVEITDWKPKEGEWIYSVVILDGNPTYRKCLFSPREQNTLTRGRIVRTESEAKQLVERLKQAML